MVNVAIVGGGIAGMATAARLQARGLSTTVLEAHTQPGGCAGWYCRRGFSFDVGATTLVDFEQGGVGGEFLESIGIAAADIEPLPGYVAWLPDRTVTLHRDPIHWSRERKRAMGDSDAHRCFWALVDELAAAFWNASRKGVCLPIRRPADLRHALACLGARSLPLVRYLRWTMADALQKFGLGGEVPLRGLLSMLLEDTVHADIDGAPLINGALGISIRGAGLSRAKGGMRGFWRAVSARYRALGGVLRVNCRVNRIIGRAGAFQLQTSKGSIEADQVVAAIPIEAAVQLVESPIADRLKPFVLRDASARGGAIVVCLGVPDEQVSHRDLTHHQLLHDYFAPLGNGNNMFLSVSSPGDVESAPPGHRAVMISTHCELAEWENLAASEYQRRKAAIGERLIGLARRVYPALGDRCVVSEIATPRTFERFTRRPRGAVGGVRQSLRNANQRAVPHDIGVPGFWLAGDTTWPGLGTVACVLGSRIVGESAFRLAAAIRRRRTAATTLMSKDALHAAGRA